MRFCTIRRASALRASCIRRSSTTSCAGCCKRKGRLFHYTGTPNKLTSGRDVPARGGDAPRRAGFGTELHGDGVRATRK